MRITINIKNEQMTPETKDEFTQVLKDIEAISHHRRSENPQVNIALLSLQSTAEELRKTLEQEGE